MRYRYSQLDIDNKNWMKSDDSCATLNTIQLTEGHLRGIFPFEIKFTYPISAIAGENGSGKSTLLAMAACAFHNHKDGYKFKGEKNPYYTFRDFFVQTIEEVPPAGVNIRYEIHYNNWYRSGSGLGWQARKKKKKGRWNNYDRRVWRNVIYFGIQRVVPHSERSAHKSYCKYFSPGNLAHNKKQDIQKIAGIVLGKNYTDFDLHEYSKYRLPVVDASGVHYSGFNMGAGESTVFSILTALFEAGKGTLLVIDEIELGLHEKAQKKLIKELIKLCNDLHCQVICSTHSPVILDSLPPEARFYIEPGNNCTKIIPEISADYACGKLAGDSSNELDVFVEDGVSLAILTKVLPLSLRERIIIIPIGSSEAILRQLSARYREQHGDCIAFLDGDKNSEHMQSITKIKNYLETRYDCSESDMDKWIDSRLKYLPGST